MGIGFDVGFWETKHTSFYTSFFVSILFMIIKIWLAHLNRFHRKDVVLREADVVKFLFLVYNRL